MSAFLAINGGTPVRKETIPIHKPVIDTHDINAVSEAVRSTFVSGDGPACRDFEKKLADYLGIKHVFFTTSCTAALDLAFRIKEFPPGSEVIVPNFTFTSTALAPLLNNLNVVLAEVYDDNGNIDPAKLEGLITDKTVAISPVDYAGNPANMESINELAKKYDLFVVHDTAQSIGAELNGIKTGRLAEVSCFSFHGTKNITTGEGGALVTESDEIAEKVKILRDKGTDKYYYLLDPSKKGYYEYVSAGNSYVQSNILGALGISQLEKIDYILERRRHVAAFYIREFSGLDRVRLPRVTENSNPNWHIFFILVPPDKKILILDAINAEGISCNVHYRPLHMNRLYSHLGSDRDFESSVRFFNSLIRIPIYPSLTDSEVEDIVKAVKKVCDALI